MSAQDKNKDNTGVGPLLEKQTEKAPVMLEIALLDRSTAADIDGARVRYTPKFYRDRVSGRTASEIVHPGPHVTVRFPDGTTYEADLIVTVSGEKKSVILRTREEVVIK